MTQYIIWDTKAKQQVGGVYFDRHKAGRRADKLDMAYGAIRYVVKRLPDNEGK